MRKKYTPQIFASIFALALSGTANSAILTTMGTFGSFDLQSFYSYEDGEDPSSMSLNIASEAITGLQKFDPTLGTLTRATVSAVFDYEITTSIFVGDFLTPGSDPHSASFQVNSGAADGENAYVYVRYQETPSSFRLVAPEDFQPGDACSGSNSFEPCGNFSTDQRSYGSSEDLLGLSFVDPADLIGTGNVDKLAMAILVPEGSDWITDNVLFADGEIIVDVFAGTVSIEYEFTPVPIPAAAWLFGSALVGMGTIARKRKTKV